MEKNKNILQKTIYFLGLLISIILTIYVFKTDFDPKNAAAFSKSLSELLTNALLILFLICLILFHFFKQKESDNNHLRSIIFGLLGAFILVITTNYFVNPRGIYGPTIFPPLVTNLRKIKVINFEKLEETPDVVIIGSSRALSINPDYIEEITGLSSYNFGVTGTFLDEYLLILQYIFDKDPGDPPKVILMDRLGFSVSPEMTANRAPFQFLSLIDKESRYKTLVNRIADLSNIHQFSEALYVLQYAAFNHEVQPIWAVSENGFGLPHFEKSFSEAIEESLSDRADRKPCDIYFPEESILILEEIVTLTKQHNATLLFYTSPNQPDYTERLREIKLQNSDLEDDLSCGQVESEFYENLVNANQHVHSVLFSHPDDFGGYSDERGYFDGAHMTEANSNLLIAALSESILNAYQETIQIRNLLKSP